MTIEEKWAEYRSALVVYGVAAYERGLKPVDEMSDDEFEHGLVVQVDALDTAARAFALAVLEETLEQAGLGKEFTTDYLAALRARIAQLGDAEDASKEAS